MRWINDRTARVELVAALVVLGAIPCVLAALESPLAARRAARIMEQNSITLARAIQVAEEHVKGRAIDAESYLAPADETRSGAGQQTSGGRQQNGGTEQHGAGQQQGQQGAQQQQQSGQSSGAQQQPGQTSESGKQSSGQAQTGQGQSSAAGQSQGQQQSGQTQVGQTQTGQTGQAQTEQQVSAQAQRSGAESAESGRALKFAITCVADNRVRVVTVDARTGRVEGIRSARFAQRGADFARRDFEEDFAAFRQRQHMQAEEPMPEWRDTEYMERDGVDWESQREADWERRPTQRGSMREMRFDEGAPRGPMLQTSRISELLGTRVRNPMRENLGEIDDLAIKVPSGQIAYAVLSFGGMIGSGDKLFAIPWNAFRFREGQMARLDIERGELEQSPGFNRDQWPTMPNERWAARFQRDGNGTGTGMNGHATVRRASRLIGTSLQTEGGQKLGTIEDVVVDSAQARAVYVVVAPQDKPDKLTILPWELIELKEDSTTARLEPQAFQAAPVFREEALPNTANRTMAVRIHRYFHLAPYWLTGQRPMRDQQFERGHDEHDGYEQ